MRNKFKGFTLVELLLYMGLLTILLSVLTAIFVSALDVQLESQATSAVEQDGNFILARLAYDIRRASIINIPSTNGLPPTSNFEIVVDGVNYNYSTDGSDNLVLTNNLGTNNLNSYGSRILGLSVIRLGNTGGVEDTLKISFTVTSRAQRVSGPETRNFKTTLSLRRK